MTLRNLKLNFTLFSKKYDRSRHASLKALTRSFSGVVLTPELNIAFKNYKMAEKLTDFIIPVFSGKMSLNSGQETL